MKQRPTGASYPQISQVTQITQKRQKLERSPKDDFVAATEPTMSAICIRYVTGGLDQTQRAELHRLVARRVEEDGQFWFSTTALKGESYFRICPVNFRTRDEHMDQLFDFLREACESEVSALHSNAVTT